MCLRALRRDGHPDGEHAGDERAEKRHPHGHDDSADDDLEAHDQARQVDDGDGSEDGAGYFV